MARGIDPTAPRVTHCEECPADEFEWGAHNHIDPDGPILFCRTHRLAAPGWVYEMRV